MDVSVFTNLGFCLLYFTIGSVGIAYGIAKKSKPVLVVAAAISIIAGVLLLAGNMLINGID